MINIASELPEHKIEKCVSIVSLDNQKYLILFLYSELTLPGITHDKTETLHLAYEHGMG